MTIGIRALVVLLVLSLVAGCSGHGATETAPSTPVPQYTDTLEPAAVGSVPACPPADGEGSVAPAASIYSVVFAVNGVEQVVQDGDTLQASPGDEVQVREVTVCVGSFAGDGGELCVDLAPVDRSGQEIASEHGGTHTVPVLSGFTSISGPDRRWVIGEDWSEISFVLNHWPPEGTEDLGCGDGRCERDDWMIVGFR